MGVGYTASALHTITYLDVSGYPGDQTRFPDIDLSIFEKKPMQQARFRSFPAAEIILWRNQLAAKYRDQFGELLTWDEGSDFSELAETATGADVSFRYVAALLDERGPDGIHDLVGTTKPGHAEIARALNEANRRGFAGRFPQLLLVSKYWLPFQRNMVIEEPSWLGTVERFGSNYRLLEELQQVRDAILSRRSQCRLVDGGIERYRMRRYGLPGTPARPFPAYVQLPHLTNFRFGLRLDGRRRMAPFGTCLLALDSCPRDHIETRSGILFVSLAGWGTDVVSAKTCWYVAASIGVAALITIATVHAQSAAPPHEFKEAPPPEPALAFRVTFGMSFLYFDACGDHKVGEVYRHALLEKFALVSFRILGHGVVRVFGIPVFFND